MFGGRGLRRVARPNQNGPVAIPRGEKVQLRTSTSIGRTTVTSVNKTKENSVASPQEPILPSRTEASNSPAWHGQTLEYATGVVLRQYVLEPILQEEGLMAKDEMARFLSHYCRGKLLFLPTSSGAVHLASIERVTSKDELTITSWWNEDKVLSYTGGKDWSEWWTQRCNFIDPGCEYVKLVGEDDQTLAVAYFERSIFDKHGEGGRITLIRGLRIDPKLNPDAIRRSSRDRLQRESPIAYSDVAAALLCHIVFTSIRYGTQGVAVNCPKADSIEDFYQHFMGLPQHIDTLDGRRYFRLDDRLGLLRLAFREQVDLKLEYKGQVGRFPSTLVQQTPEAKGGITVDATDRMLLQRTNDEKHDESVAQTLSKFVISDIDHGAARFSVGTPTNYESSETSKHNVSNGLDASVRTVEGEESENPIENDHNGVGGSSGKTKRLKVSS